jgi:hypothetical protein
MKIRADTIDENRVPNVGDRFVVTRVDKPHVWWNVELEKDERDIITLVKEERDKCKALPNKEDQIECIFDLLFKVTTAQDHTNLTIRSILDDDEDPRWIPIHIIDDANGVILGISRNRGKPELVVSEGYTGEKMRHIIDKWSMMNWRLQR